jgi:hypothetical protein
MAAAKLIMIPMMGSDLQSMKRCGSGCPFVRRDSKGGYEVRPIDREQLLVEYNHPRQD